METNNTQAALDAGRMLSLIQRVAYDGVTAPVVVGPNGSVVVIDPSAVERWLPAPKRKTGTWAFGDIESLTRYINEHKTEDTRIWASISDAVASFKAVLNFHGKEPSFNDHTAIHALKPTKEWALWVSRNGVRMPQVAFAEFIEENAKLFTDPNGADLLELIKNLEGHSNASFSQAVKLENGAVKLVFTEDVVLKGSGGAVTAQEGNMEIPSLLNVGIAPFEGVPPYAIQARLRYRIAERKITFWYETINAHLVIKDVCKNIIDQIKEKTGIQPFIA